MVTCLTDGRSAGAGARGAEHLQHCFPRGDQAGHRQLRWEGTASGKAQVGRQILQFATLCQISQQNTAITDFKSYFHWNIVLLKIKSTSPKKPFPPQQPFVLVSLESATSRCLTESLGVWRPCTPSPWHSGLWTAGWLKRSTTTSRPSSSSACRSRGRSRWPASLCYANADQLLLMWVRLCGPPSQWAVQNPREQCCRFPGGRPRSPSAHCGPPADQHQLRVRSQLNQSTKSGLDIR